MKTGKLLLTLLAVAGLAIAQTGAVVSSVFPPDTNFLTNDGSTGTVQGEFMMVNSSGNAVVLTASATSGNRGLVIGQAGTTGMAAFIQRGVWPVIMDSASCTAGDYVVASSTAGKGHDSGATTRPTSGVQVLGVCQGTAAPAPAVAYWVVLEPPGSLAIPFVNANRRVCPIPVGDTSGSALTNGQLGPQKRICLIPTGSTLIEMDVAADGGTPNVIVGRNRAGTIVNVVSGALATAASGGIACSNTGGTTGIDGATTCGATLQNTGLNAGDYLELVSGTAGGTAKLMTINLVYTIN